MTIKLQGELEIDQERGVIYFHASEQRANAEQRYQGRTVLRIQGMSPIPYESTIDMGIEKGELYMEHQVLYTYDKF